MAWTPRGWLWYIRGAILRRLGSNRNLITLLALIAICSVSVYAFHANAIRNPGEISFRNIGISLISPPVYEEDLAQEELPDYPKMSERPDNKGSRGRSNMRMKKKKKKKGFNHKPIVKPGSIASRKDKLMFSYSGSQKKGVNQSPLVNSKKKKKNGHQTYQEDVVVDGIEWTRETEQDRRREFRQRSLRAQRECDNDTRGRLKRVIGKVYEHLKWVDRYDIVYCPIFKAGSTTWMKNLLLLAGDTKMNGSLHNKVTSLYPQPSSRQRMQSLLEKSLKFMIVRHPFDRLLSAYRDKMLRELKIDDPYRRLQLSILKNYDHVTAKTSTVSDKDEEALEETPDSKETADHPSFLQFLYKVRDEMKFFWKVMDGTLVDPHWTPYWYTCAPCQVHYDIIAKIETLDLDQEFIIRAANLHGILPNTRTHASKFDGYNATETAAEQYFRDIPLELLKELEQLYSPDFKLFGYTAEKYLQMAALSGA